MAKYNPGLNKVISIIYGRTDDVSWEELYEMSKVFIWNAKTGSVDDKTELAMRLIWNLYNVAEILKEPSLDTLSGMILVNNRKAMKDLVADYIYRGRAKGAGLTTEMLAQADIALNVRTDLI